jgi:hypothetical protein
LHEINLKGKTSLEDPIKIITALRFVIVPESRMKIDKSIFIYVSVEVENLAI